MTSTNKIRNSFGRETAKDDVKYHNLALKVLTNGNSPERQVHHD